MEDELVLSPAMAAFLQSGVSVRLASSTGGFRPVVGRALGASVDQDRRHVHLVLAERPSGPILQAVRETGVLAAAFTRPITHRSIQLKTTAARVEPALPGDAELIARQGSGFVLELTELGYPASLIEAIRTYEPGPLVRVSFAVAGAFDQTPGPGAGEPVAP